MKSRANHIATIPSLPVSHDAESFTNTKKPAKNKAKKIMGHDINCIITQSFAEPFLSHPLTYFYKIVKSIQNVINLLHRQNIFAAYKNQKINSHLKITQQ
jgi:hypothetical protein